jgi:hypothetical protein
MRVRPWIRWYLRLLRQTAQPRDEAAVERSGLRRLVFGYRTPGSGWGAVLWSFEAAVLALIVLWSPFAGIWWFGLAVLPLLAHSVARSIGTFREGHLY